MCVCVWWRGYSLLHRGLSVSLRIVTQGLCASELAQMSEQGGPSTVKTKAVSSVCVGVLNRCSTNTSVRSCCVNSAASQKPLTGMLGRESKCKTDTVEDAHSCSCSALERRFVFIAHAVLSLPVSGLDSTPSLPAWLIPTFPTITLGSLS